MPARRRCILEIFSTVRDTTGGPVPGEGVHVTTFWSEDIATTPSFFLNAALPVGGAILTDESCQAARPMVCEAGHEVCSIVPVPDLCFFLYVDSA